VRDVITGVGDCVGGGCQTCGYNEMPCVRSEIMKKCTNINQDSQSYYIVGLRKKVVTQSL